MNISIAFRVALLCGMAIFLNAAWIVLATAQTDSEEGIEESPSGFPPVGSGAGEHDAVGTSKTPKSPFGPPPGAILLSKKDQVWVDVKRHAVFVDGRVALREGPPIEMFACPHGTKEHESIVAVDAKASTVHAGLLAAGAKIGHPVQLDPYKAATGTTIDIIVEWMDADGRRHRTPAQHWVRHVATGKHLDHSWVFAGSGFWVDEATGVETYQGDSGDFICVSNFDTATLDLPIASSQATADLLYQPFTERIPSRGTPVRLVLLPRLHDMPDVKEGEKESTEEDQDDNASSEEDPAALDSLEITLQHEGDEVRVREGKAAMLIDVTSKSGIGRATVRRPENSPWPMQLNVRLQYAARKAFAHLEGFTLSTAQGSYHNSDTSAPDVEVRSIGDEGGDAPAVDGIKMPIAKHDGAMEITLPMSVLKDAEEFTVQWVDLYR